MAPTFMPRRTCSILAGTCLVSCSVSACGRSPSGATASCGEDVCSSAEMDSGSGRRDAQRDSSRDAHDGTNRDAHTDSSREASVPPDANGDGGASCLFDGMKVASGSSVTAYEASNVDAGTVCVSESRQCMGGTLSGTYAFASCSVALVPAFYVSPMGDDTNPGTLLQPFLTLPKAQSAMRSSMSVKTTYLRGGTYPLTASSASTNCNFGAETTAIDLTAADDGETWSYYPPDGFASAILDGGSTSATPGVGCAFAAIATSGLTFLGLEIQHFQYSGIWAESSPNLVAKDNTIHDLTGAVFNVGGIALHTSSGATVTNNYIHDVAYVGVGAWGGTMSNTTISGNVILSSCTSAAMPGGLDMDGGDCGGIYTWDNTHLSTNILVTNNYVRDVNVSSNGVGDYSGCCATGIYVDDGMSNVTVSGNVVTGIKSQCFVIHGGNSNTFTNNICDEGDSQDQRIMTYQWDNLMLQMTGNAVENNIIVSGSSGAGTGYSDNGTPTPPVIKNNAYWNYVGMTIDSSGSAGSDMNPTYENPGLSCWDPVISNSSPVLNAPVSWKPLAGGWGPPGFVLPQTGTPPSWPHGC